MELAVAVGAAFVPGADVLVAVVALVAELHGSRAMCEQLVTELQAVQSRLEELLQHSAVTVKEALTQYQMLVNDIHGFLLVHQSRSLLARVASHGKVKDRIQQFHSDLERVKSLMQLDHQLQSAVRHVVVTDALTRSEQLLEHFQADTSRDMQSLRRLVVVQREELARELRQDNVSLADLVDLKKETKTNAAAYTREQLAEIDALLKNAASALAVTVPHVSSWHLSRDDIVYDDGNPFAAAELKAMYHGTMLSGARVVVKTVRAPDNAKDMQQFNEEVKMWYELRHPHVLPLYGANNVGDPLLLVMGRAQCNVRDYVARHPHRLWSVFLDAARGLAYLHRRKPPIVHANLKCSNLLVTAEGVGVVSDFQFAFVRASSTLSVKPPAPSLYWKAPERFNVLDPNARFPSDVYGLGMCLFEALTDSVPYAGVENDDRVREMICSGTLPTVPQGKAVSAEAWALIERMCDRQPSRRASLDVVISTMEMLTIREQRDNAALKCECQAPTCRACYRPVRL